MDLKTIQNLISEGHESAILEFKKSTAQLKGAGETLCAFLNGAGGVVLIGVTDKGKIVGQEVTESTKRQIGNILAQLSPEANIITTYISIKENKHVVVMEAEPDTTLRPYTFDNRPYVRLESNTIAMPREQFQRMSVHSVFNNRNWESEILQGVTMEDLDDEEIMNTIKRGIANKRIPSDQLVDNPEAALKKMGLLVNGKITNAAVVLFGKEPANLLPQCGIRLARFKGIDKSEFADSKIIDGNAFKIISEAMIFADRYLPVSSRFETGNIYRIDEPLFSVDALREVFANAVGHRDYGYLRNATLSFAIYDDRLEIWSPGLPPSGITFDNIKTLHESFPRNRLIARVLYYNKLFETWGRGVKMVVEECLKAGHPEPEFIEKANGVCVILRSKQSLAPPIVITNLPEGVVLTKTQEEILLNIQRCNEISIAEIQQKLSRRITSRAIQKNLKQLKDLGLVATKGRGRNTLWVAVFD